MNNVSSIKNDENNEVKEITSMVSEEAKGSEFMGFATTLKKLGITVLEGPECEVTWKGYMQKYLDIKRSTCAETTISKMKSHLKNTPFYRKDIKMIDIDKTDAWELYEENKDRPSLCSHKFNDAAAMLDHFYHEHGLKNTNYIREQFNKIKKSCEKASGKLQPYTKEQFLKLRKAVLNIKDPELKALMILFIAGCDRKHILTLKKEDIVIDPKFPEHSTMKS